MSQRICVIGTSCSGKTTLARAISEKLAIPHIELDALHWLPNWVERDDEEFVALVGEAADGDSWVIDGNYSKARGALWPRATTIIWLDYAFPLVMYRAVTRTAHRVFTGKELYAGNVETFRQSFLSKDSIILWAATTHFEKRRTYPALLAQQRERGANILVLNSPAQTRRLLDGLANAEPADHLQEQS